MANWFRCITCGELLSSTYSEIGEHFADEHEGEFLEELKDDDVEYITDETGHKYFAIKKTKSE